ncbi:hypothetical protein ACROYT_G022271 [Oculina patagonica]
METTYRVVDNPAQKSKRTGIFLKYKAIAAITVVTLVVLISVVVLAAILGPGRKRSSSEACDGSNAKQISGDSKDEQTTQMTCDVAIVGGGISGLYVAETLVRLQKETNVCLFEREDRFGGRIRDHTFQRVPNIPVSLGAWRVDEGHSAVWDIFKRFNISASQLAKNHHDRLEARGIFATDSLTLKQKAFPALNHGRFQNSTYIQMVRYLFSQQKEASKFASFQDFVSEYLTPEGLQLFSHLNAFIPDYSQEGSAESVFEAEKAYAMANSTGNYFRPDSGFTEITRALKMSALKHGAKLYKDQEIIAIDEDQEKQFKLRTSKYLVTANKLVVAIPVDPMKKIKGSVAEKIKNDSTFDSIGVLLAFKGFAVFEEAWWQLNSTRSRYLADEQEMLSNSDCLGFTFPYKPRGPNGEAVLQMSYAKIHCAVKWGELLKVQSKEYVDQEMHRSLKRLFPGVDVPKPLESVYVYWDKGFMHAQRAGTHISSFKVVDWAKRPFPGQDLFIVGEAYHPLRGWIEGALQSAQNALLEGWNIGSLKDPTLGRALSQERVINNHMYLKLSLFP